MQSFRPSEELDDGHHVQTLRRPVLVAAAAGAEDAALGEHTLFVRRRRSPRRSCVRGARADGGSGSSGERRAVGAWLLFGARARRRAFLSRTRHVNARTIGSWRPSHIVRVLVTRPVLMMCRLQPV